MYGGQPVNDPAFLGQMTTPGGGAGDNNPQTITGVVQTVTGLPNGSYSLVTDVTTYVIQGKNAIVSALTAAQIRNLGVKIPANTEVYPIQVDSVNNDTIAWVDDGTTAGADFRLNLRSAGKTT